MRLNNSMKNFKKTINIFLYITTGMILGLVVFYFICNLLDINNEQKMQKIKDNYSYLIEEKIILKGDTLSIDEIYVNFDYSIDGKLNNGKILPIEIIEYLSINKNKKRDDAVVSN